MQKNITVFDVVISEGQDAAIMVDAQLLGNWAPDENYLAAAITPAGDIVFTAMNHDTLIFEGATPGALDGLRAADDFLLAATDMASGKPSAIWICSLSSQLSPRQA